MLGREKIIEVEKVLHNAGLYDRLEAEWVVTLALSKDRISEVLNLELNDADINRIDNVLLQRISGKPLAYIIGNAEFYGRNFVVDENVLIPRPETELLVDKLVQDINKSKAKLNVLDLCTGSGAIGITIALETNTNVLCSDISEGAIKVAERNNNNLNANIKLIQSDLFAEIFEKFDIIVSNPPYIKSEDVLSLDKEVRDFEPHLALDGGDSGLDFYKKIISEAPNYLKPNGKLYFEIGIGQSEDVKELMKNDFENIEVIKDYNKIDRVIIGKLRV